MGMLRSRVTAVAAGSLIVVGLGAGGAVAAGTFGSDDVRNQSIRSWDIHRGAIGASELRGGRGAAVDKAHIDNNAVGYRELMPWVTKDIRKPGPRGPEGTDGKDGVSGYEVVGRGTDAVALTANESATITSLCKSADQEANDKVASAGGAKATAGSMTVNGSYPSDIEQVGPKTEQDPAGLWAAKSWTVEVTAGANGATVQPFVICQDNAEDDA